jgi:hypothetical protein
MKLTLFLLAKGEGIDSSRKSSSVWTSFVEHQPSTSSQMQPRLGADLPPHFSLVRRWACHEREKTQSRCGLEFRPDSSPRPGALRSTQLKQLWVLEVTHALMNLESASPV